MHLANLRWYSVFFGYLATHVKAYPVQAWYPPQGPREYPDDEYYYAPKIQYYYDAPAMSVPEVYGQMPYPYDPYEHFLANDGPKRQEERLAALPIGQETWFEHEGNSQWRSNDIDDVSAAFLDNLILTQMAQDAQRRRENARAAFPSVDYEEKTPEDEDVRELKALAGQPEHHAPNTVPEYHAANTVPEHHVPNTVPEYHAPNTVPEYHAPNTVPEYHAPKTVPEYHAPKTVPEYHAPNTVPKVDDYDYASDESFINWNGNKRSYTTAAPTQTTIDPKVGQKEVAIPPQGHNTKVARHVAADHKRKTDYYEKIVKLMMANSEDSIPKESTKERRINKRFVAGDSDLVLELRGLKHRIAT